MIRFLNDETVAGYRFGKGTIATFDNAIETALIGMGDAENYPLPVLISQSYSPVTRSSDNATDATFVVLASVTVPGGTMNLNGKLVIEQDWKYTNSASTKTFALDWNGVNVVQDTATTTVRTTYHMEVKNLNSLSSQTILNKTTYGLAASDSTGSANTANDVAIDHKCKWGANVASEQIILLGYSIWYYPGNS